MSRQMYRYTVPVDDEQHAFRLTGNPVAVAATADARAVEFWAEHDDDAGIWRGFAVVGTGQTIPDSAKWVGTCQRVHGLVWHLYEVPVVARGLAAGGGS